MMDVTKLNGWFKKVGSPGYSYSLLSVPLQFRVEQEKAKKPEPTTTWRPVRL